MVFSQQNILCINERWPGKALLRTTQSSEALTFTSIFPGWQLYEPFHLHSTPPITSRKQEGGRGRDRGERECKTVAMVGRGGQAGD